MTSDQIAEAVRRAQEQWGQLKEHWFDLKLPGSAYSPGEFLTALIISQVPGQPAEIAARVQEGQARLRALEEQGVLSRFGSDGEKMMVCALAVISAQEQTAPPAAAETTTSVPSTPVDVAIPEPEVVREVVIGPCPHCGHDPERCAAGEYAAPPLPPTSPIVEAAPASVEAEPEVQSVGCEHVGTDGKCFNCTEDETEECSGDCGDTVVVAKASKCKGYDECGRLYCKECGDQLSEYGYCDDCGTLTCDGCGTNVDHGTEKRCANAKCKVREDFCEECAPRLLNSEGLCAECAKEGTWDCDDCGMTYLESRITKCVGDECEHGYCDECKGTNLDDEGKGLCMDCVS